MSKASSGSNTDAALASAFRANAWAMENAPNKRAFFGVIDGAIALLESIRTRVNPIRDWDERDFQYAIDHQKR
jgi:3'-phosphoadenosine 5'-phosphosulfate sulfotransferase (PAPS reductase)/FAD synthetase